MNESVDEETFDKAMTDTDWREVRERQAARGEHTDAWFDDLALDSGDDAFEVGCGPGYVTERLADRVGPRGRVVALDRRVEALAYFAADAPEQVSLLLADAEALPLAPREPTTVLVAYVLHHAEHPERVLGELADALPAGSRVFAVEYDPDASGEVGPPVDHRIAESALADWFGDAGLDPAERFTYENESYALLAEV